MTAFDAAKLLLAKALEDETLVVKTLADLDISDTIIGFHCQQAKPARNYSNHFWQQ
jgi:hypothetical protein